MSGCIFQQIRRTNHPKVFALVKTHKPSIKQKVTPIVDKMEVSPERILCFHRNLKVFALVKT